MDYESTKESSRRVVFSEDDKPIIVRSERLLSTHNGQSTIYSRRSTIDPKRTFAVD